MLKVYAPSWFEIPSKQSVVDCSNLFKFVEDVMTRNCYFAHPENLLLAMSKDEDVEIKTKALALIAQAREKETPNLRVYQKVKINFSAKSYHDMIDWEKVPLTEPPMYKGIPIDEIDDFEVPDYKCHTQGTERMVKLVTKASQQVFGHQRREGVIHATKESIGANPGTSFSKIKYK